MRVGPQLEQKVNEVVKYYTSKKQMNTFKGSLGGKEKRKPGVANNSGSNNSGNKLGDGSRKEAVCSKRMQDLMRQFGAILKQVTFSFLQVLLGYKHISCEASELFPLKLYHV